MSVISAPLDWVELVSDLRLPPKADRRLQDLMDRNTEGQLTAEEAADLESLVELSQTLSLVRAEALRLLRAQSKVTSSWDEIQHQVAERAAERCEYCRMHQALQAPLSTSNILCRGLGVAIHDWKTLHGHAPGAISASRTVSNRRILKPG